MEWIDLAIWIVAALLALALWRGALDQPALGLTVLATIAALALLSGFLLPLLGLAATFALLMALDVASTV